MQLLDRALDELFTLSWGVLIVPDSFFRYNFIVIRRHESQNDFIRHTACVITIRVKAEMPCAVTNERIVHRAVSNAAHTRRIVLGISN